MNNIILHVYGRPDNYEEGWYADETTGEWYNQFDWVQDESTGEWYYEDRYGTLYLTIYLQLLLLL